MGTKTLSTGVTSVSLALTMAKNMPFRAIIFFDKKDKKGNFTEFQNSL